MNKEFLLVFRRFGLAYAGLGLLSGCHFEELCDAKDETDAFADLADGQDLSGIWSYKDDNTETSFFLHLGPGNRPERIYEAKRPSQDVWPWEGDGVSVSFGCGFGYAYPLVPGGRNVSSLPPAVDLFNGPGPTDGQVIRMESIFWYKSMLCMKYRVSFTRARLKDDVHYPSFCFEYKKESDSIFAHKLADDRSFPIDDGKQRLFGGLEYKRYVAPQGRR